MTYINWSETIFCQFSDIKLSNSILDFATDNNCEVIEGKLLSDDIVTTPAFVYIIDRNLIGIDNWQIFLESIEESELEITCIVLDENSQYENPHLGNFTYINMEQNNYKKIIDIIASAHLIAAELNDIDYDY